MILDLRLPLGLLFGVIGLLLTAYGAASDRSIYQVSLGINVNVWAGLGMLVFGLLMLAGAWRGQGKAE
jgi:hypothetical protein